MRIHVIVASSIVLSCGLVLLLTRDLGQQAGDSTIAATASTANEASTEIRIESSDPGLPDQTSSPTSLVTDESGSTGATGESSDQSDSAEILNLSEAFQAEEIDSSWASQTETELLALISDSGIRANIVETECRSSTCRLMVISGVSEEEFLVPIFTLLPPLLENNLARLSGGVVITPRDASAPTNEWVIYLRDWDGISVVRANDPQA